MDWSKLLLLLSCLLFAVVAVMSADSAANQLVVAAKNKEGAPNPKKSPKKNGLHGSLYWRHRGYYGRGGGYYGRGGGGYYGGDEGYYHQREHGYAEHSGFVQPHPPCYDCCGELFEDSYCTLCC